MTLILSDRRSPASRQFSLPAGALVLFLVLMAATVPDRAGAALAAEPGTNPGWLRLPADPTNAFHLKVRLSPSPEAQAPAGAFQLDSAEGPLLTDLHVTPRAPAPSRFGPVWGTPREGAAFEPPQTALRLIATVQSNEWEYACVDLTPLHRGLVRRHWRHLLFVAPDLFAVYDEAEPGPASLAPARPELFLSAPQAFSLEAASGDFRLDTPTSGLTAHVLTSSRRSYEPWAALQPATDPAGHPPGEWVYRIRATNEVSEARLLTLMIPYRAGRKGDTGFKLLQSNNAFGARIWRNGLPTLIAFRTSPAGEPAALTSMPIEGPVAVDVFHPRKPVAAPQRAPQPPAPQPPASR